jgi:hypothetical protein
MSTAALFQNINEFLAERKESSPGGGWAPVTQDELQELNAIIHDLIELKYEYDADHDLPVTWGLTDRTMFKTDGYSSLYHNKAIGDLTEQQIAQFNLDRAIGNMSQAAEEVKLAKRLFDMYNTESRK